LNSWQIPYRTPYPFQKDIKLCLLSWHKGFPVAPRTKGIMGELAVAQPYYIALAFSTIGKAVVLFVLAFD
jgi:hypothetical protein